ncbi:MAG: bleomycin resistance protein [Puniceicoccales bacterium]
MTQSPELTGVAPVLLVQDVLLSSDYYRDGLGFKVEGLYGEPTNFAILERDGLRLMLQQTEPTNVRPHWKVAAGIWNAYFWVKDADRLHAEFVQRGAKIDYPPGDQPYGCREFGIQDIDGYDIGFGQILPPS